MGNLENNTPDSLLNKVFFKKTLSHTLLNESDVTEPLCHGKKNLMNYIICGSIHSGGEFSASRHRTSAGCVPSKVNTADIHLVVKSKWLLCEGSQPSASIRFDLMS